MRRSHELGPNNSHPQLRRGDFASVEELVTAIRRFVTGWNQRCQPFAWTNDAD
jgi:hypothetical protein